MGKVKDNTEDERRRDYLKICILLKEAKANYAIYKDRRTFKELREKEKEAKKFYVKLPSGPVCDNLFGFMDLGLPKYSQSSASI